MSAELLAVALVILIGGGIAGVFLLGRMLIRTVFELRRLRRVDAAHEDAVRAAMAEHNRAMFTGRRLPDDHVDKHQAARVGHAILSGKGYTRHEEPNGERQ